MKRVSGLVVLSIAALSIGASAQTSPPAKYANYYAARDAARRGDCKAVVAHLDAFLEAHPYVPEQYPDFYFELRYVRKQCSGGLVVRGIEGESEGIDPLPEDVPMTE